MVRRPGTGRRDLLVRNPVAPLEAVGRAVLRAGDLVDIARHRRPVVLDYPRVAGHPPRRPGHGNACVCPAEAPPHDRAPAHRRRHCGIEAVRVFALRVAHVRHPLGKKTVRVGEAKRRRREYLRVAAPAHPLVALRTVGRDRKVVGVHPPARVLDQAVHVGVAGRDRAALHRLRNGSHRNRPHGVDLHRTGGGNLGVAIAKESERRHVARYTNSGRLRIVARKDVLRHRPVRRQLAEVCAVDAPARPVVAARLFAVQVVQHLAAPEGKDEAHVGPRDDLRHRRGVLAEVDDETLAGLEQDALADPQPDLPPAYGSKGVARRARDVRIRIDVRLLGIKRKVAPQRHARAFHRGDDTGEIGVHPGKNASGAVCGAILSMRIAHFAEVDSRTFERRGKIRGPAWIGFHDRARAVAEHQLHLCGQGGLCVLATAGGVGEPRTGDEGGDVVPLAFAAPPKARDVVGEEMPPAPHVGCARPEEVGPVAVFLHADQRVVDVKLERAERRGEDLHALYLRRVCDVLRKRRTRFILLELLAIPLPCW